MQMTLNAREAAERLGLHPNTVFDWLRDGRIRGERVGRAWSIPIAEVERIRAQQIIDSDSGATAQNALARLDQAWRSRRRDAAQQLVAAAQELATFVAEHPDAIDLNPALRRSDLEPATAFEQRLVAIMDGAAAMLAVRSLWDAINDVSTELAREWAESFPAAERRRRSAASN